MRVACVLIRQLRTKAEMRRQADLKDGSTLIVDGWGATVMRPRGVDYFPGVAGVKVGMTLEQAVSHHTDTIVLNADELALSAPLRPSTHILAGDQRPC